MCCPKSRPVSKRAVIAEITCRPKLIPAFVGAAIIHCSHRVPMLQQSRCRSLDWWIDVCATMNWYVMRLKGLVWPKTHARVPTVKGASDAASTGPGKGKNYWSGSRTALSRRGSKHYSPLSLPALIHHMIRKCHSDKTCQGIRGEVDMSGSGWGEHVRALGVRWTCQGQDEVDMSGH